MSKEKTTPPSNGVYITNQEIYDQVKENERLLHLGFLVRPTRKEIFGYFAVFGVLSGVIFGILALI